MVHTEFSDDVDRFPYNVNDGADIYEVLNVSKCIQCSHLVYHFIPFRDFQLCHQVVLLQRNHNKTELVWHTCSHFVPSRILNWALHVLLMLVNLQLEAFAQLVRPKWQCLCIRCLFVSFSTDKWQQEDGL